MPEIFSAFFATTLTVAITDGTRPLIIGVASTTPPLNVTDGTFSILVYDVGWDGTTETTPTNHVEAMQVTTGGATTSWTCDTESGWTPTVHSIGSIVVATVLTPRSLTQQMVDHTTYDTIPNPHPYYLRGMAFQNKGSLLFGTGVGTYSEQVIGADDTTIIADSTTTSGVRWGAPLVAILSHMGDLIIGGAQGLAARLGIGSLGQQLVVQLNTPSIFDPSTGPVCSATGSGGSLVNGTIYDIAYAWQTIQPPPDGGLTLPSFVTQFTATSSGTVFVTCPAAPASNMSLLVYAAMHGAPLQLQSTLTPAAITTQNSVTLSSVFGGALASTINTTGGISAGWAPGGSVSSVGLNMPPEFVVASSPVTTSGTLAVSKSTQAPHTVYAGPAGGITQGIPTFRTLAVGDLPFIGLHDEFAPTTAQTTVSLSQAPYVILTVAVNGAVKYASDYTYAGFTVTFTTPFTTGDKVMVAYLATNPLPILANVSLAGLAVTATSHKLTAAQVQGATASINTVAVVKAGAVLSATASRVTTP